MFFERMNGGGGRSRGGPVDSSLYEILKVRPTASNDEIKKAYRHLAKEYHPDKNPAHGDKFKEISFAYEVLSNPERRSVYDEHGLDAIKRSSSGSAFGAEDLFANLFESGGHPFSSFFGGGGHRKQRTEDIKHPLKVTLEDLYTGKSTKLQLSRNIICSACNGRGGKGANYTCEGCHGRGIKNIMRKLGPGLMQQLQVHCPDCDGAGTKIPEKDRCRTCHGKRTTKEKKVLQVQVTPGMEHGQKITFRGESDQEPGKLTGDVDIVLQLEKHEIFSRDGDDLFMNREISLNEALCGFELPIKHLDGRQIVIVFNGKEPIQPGSVRGVSNLGMPNQRHPELLGNLFINFDVCFPDPHFLSSEAEYKLLEALLGGRKVSPAVPQGEHVEEISLMPYEEHKYDRRADGGTSRQAYEEDDDEYETTGGQNVRCAQS